MQTFKNKQQKTIGAVKGNAFEKYVKKSKHLFRKWNAWGIDKTIVDGLIRDGIEIIKIHETEEKIDYSIPVKDFFQKGIEADFGHSKQIFLPVIHFHQGNIS
jgi:hypothetical protein